MPDSPSPRAPRTRQPSVVWGDESAAVDAALGWAVSHTSLAGDPKDTARPAAQLQQEITARLRTAENPDGAMITEDGIGHEKALEIFSEVLLPATRASDDPMNLAYIPAAPTRAAVAFDTAVSAANVFGGIWEAGAGAIHAENQVLAWLAGLLGWPAEARGTFVAGGTAGNLAALATARDHALRMRGGRPSAGWAVAMAASAHSSNASSARLLDMDVIEVAADEQGRLTGPALAAALEEHPNICAAVASGGTTNAGVVDDIAGIVDAARPHDVWVHVDGAYGGGALLAPSARHLFDGVERADSFIVDPHKWLFAPYDCCALLYRNPEPAVLAHAQHAPYLDAIDRGESNPSDLAAHLSRRVRGLPLWYSLAVHGTAKYSAAVERCLASAREVTAWIRQSEHLRLIAEPVLSVVLFERPGWSDEQYHRWSQRAAKDGTILCIPTRHRGRTILRLAFLNPETDPQRVIDVLQGLAE